MGFRDGLDIDTRFDSGRDFPIPARDARNDRDTWEGCILWNSLHFVLLSKLLAAIVQMQTMKSHQFLSAKSQQLVKSQR